MRTDRRGGSQRRLNPFAVRTILLGAVVIALGVSVTVVRVRHLPRGLPPDVPVAVPDYRVFDNYWDDRHGGLTSFEVTPQYVVVGSMQTGVLALDRETGLWREFTHRGTGGRLPADDVLQLCLDPDGRRLYYRTALGGLARSGTNLKDWRTLYSASACPVDADELHAASLVGERWLVLGTRTEGLCLYDAETRGWSRMKAGTGAKGPSSNEVSDLLYLKDPRRGRLLVGTPEGVDVFRADASADVSPLNFETRVLSGRSIETFDPTGEAPSDQPVVCRTSAGGVACRLPDGTWRELVGDGGLHARSTPEVSIARLDPRHELLLAGTADEGWDVYHTGRRDWLNPPNRHGGAVNDIVAFDGRWWVATDAGVQLYDPETHEVTEPPEAPDFVKSSGVVRLAADERVLYLLTAGGGVVAFRPRRQTWQTLIPHQGCEDVIGGDVVRAVTWQGELWLGFESGQVLVYNDRKHELRHEEAGLDRKESRSRFLTQMVVSAADLWCVMAETKSGAGQLFRYVGAGWTRADTQGEAVTRMAGLGDGLLAMTSTGKLLYLSDGPTGPGTFFADGPFEPVMGESTAVAVTRDRETILMARRDGGSGTTLHIYHPRRHSWSRTTIPTRSGVRELHERGGEVYVVTHAGGLLRLDLAAPDSWTDVVAEEVLSTEDAKTPTIVSAARSKDGPIYAVFLSGSVYRYSPANGAWKRVVPLPAEVRQVAATGKVLWYRCGDGSVAAAAEGRMPVTLLGGAGGLGGRPANLLLAAEDSRRRLWLLTAGGRVGAYNLATHRWDLVHQLPGTEPIRRLSWGKLRHPTGDEVWWLSTRRCSAVFRSGESGAALVAEFPKAELHTAALTGERICCLLTTPGASDPSTGRLYRMGLAGQPSELGTGVPLAGPDVTIKELTGELCVLSGDRHVLRYSERLNSWRTIATSRSGYLRLALSCWWRRHVWVGVIVLCLDAALLVALVVVLVALGRDSHRRVRRQARWIELGGLAFLAAVTVSVMGWAESCLRSSAAGERAEAHGRSGPLRWRTTPAGASLTIKGRPGYEPVFDEQGRFLFDTVQDLDQDEETVRMHTPVGVWSCRSPEGKPPDDFAGIEADFVPERSGASAGGAAGRPLFSEGVWSWHELASGVVTVYRRGAGKPVVRWFHGGQWADRVVRGIALPDGGNGVVLLDTPAGDVVLRPAADPEPLSGSGLSSQAAFGGSAGSTRSRESRSFAAPVRDESPSRFDAVAPHGLIYTESGRLEWQFGERGVTVTLDGDTVPMVHRDGRHRPAIDVVEDFTIETHSPTPTFRVKSAFGEQRYALDGTGRIVLLGSAHGRTSTAAAAPPAPPDVTHGTMVWRTSGNRVLGEYRGLGAAAEVVDGRMRHDVVHDLTVESGRLRLATPIGFLDYDCGADGSLRLVRSTSSDRAVRRCFDRRLRFVFSGRSWRELPGAAGAAPAVLNVTDPDGVLRPATPVQVKPGVYKLPFDRVHRMRLRSGRLLLETSAGLLGFSVDRGWTAAILPSPGDLLTRPSKVAVFDRDTSAWRLADRGPDVPGDSGPSSLLNVTTGPAGEIRPAAFMPSVRKFPWDYVEHLSVRNNQVWVHTHAGSIIPGTRRLIPSLQDPARGLSEAKERPGPAGLVPSWGPVIDERSEAGLTWLLCRKRLAVLRKGDPTGRR